MYLIKGTTATQCSVDSRTTILSARAPEILKSCSPTRSCEPRLPAGRRRQGVGKRAAVRL